MGTPYPVYAALFALIAYVCWRLRDRYYGDMDTYLAAGAVFFAGLVLLNLVAGFRSTGIGGRLLFVGGVVLLIFGFLRADGLPYVRPALLGVGAVFALAYAWPSSPCPVCSRRRCRCYAPGARTQIE